MKLETERLILRDLNKGDQVSLIRNINNLKISRWLLVVPYPYTKKDADWWINHCLENKKKKSRESYEFGIAIKPREEVVGGVGLSKIDKYQRKATLGYWLGEDFWRNGYMGEATRRVVDFGFTHLKLRRIDVEAFTGNKASNALIRKLGFKYEGTLRKALRCKADGKIHDGYFYGLLKEEWKKHRKKLK